MQEITIAQAMDRICNALRNDSDYWDTWKANIAMAVHDEYYSKSKSNLSGDELHQVFNDSADRFLRLLTGKSTTERHEEVHK